MGVLTNAISGGVENPLIATTDSEMSELLNDSKKLGMFVKFTGTSTTYVKDQIYRILESGDTEQYVPKADTVQKGLVFEDYDIDGFPHTAKLVGMTNIPNGYCTRLFYDWGSSRDSTFTKKITSITIPSSVTSVGDWGFDSNDTLTNVKWEEPINLDSQNVGVGMFASCQGLTSITIPSHWTSIPSSFLNNCQHLTSIIIPQNVTIIGNGAFYFCKRLTSLIIPEKVERLEHTCFEDCDALTSLTIPSSVTYIGAVSLEIGTTSNKATITFKGTTPPTIETSTFNTAKLNKIYVPSASLEAYKTAEKWSAFANYIEADPNE